MSINLHQAITEAEVLQSSSEPVESFNMTYMSDPTMIAVFGKASRTHIPSFQLMAYILQCDPTLGRSLLTEEQHNQFFEIVEIARQNWRSRFGVNNRNSIIITDSIVGL